MHASFKIETAASLMKNVILLVRNSVCLLKKNNVAVKSNLHIVNLKAMPLLRPSSILPDNSGKQDIGT